MNTNWSYVPFSQIFNWCKKSTIGSNDGKPSGKYKLFIASATKIKYFDEYLEEGESLIFGTGGNPCIYYVNEKFAYTNHTETAKKKIDNVNLKFYYYYFQKNKFEQLSTTFVGGGIKNSSKKKIGALMVPLPDIDEQNKIVAKIEELFSELDKAVDTLQNIKKQLAVYRQAVLKEAFEGNLTNSKPIQKDILLNYIETPRYGTSKKCTYIHDSSYKAVYRIPNIDHRTGRINHEDIKYANFTDNELSGIKLKKGDLLIIRSNGSVSLVGRAALVTNFDTEGTFAGYLMRIRIAEQNNLLPLFLYLYLQSYDARWYIENKAKSTSGVHNINSTEISHLSIPIYPIIEQKMIIDAVESRFSVCDNIEKTIDTALLQSEALRQTILKQAFEGELIK